MHSQLHFKPTPVILVSQTSCPVPTIHYSYIFHSFLRPLVLGGHFTLHLDVLSFYSSSRHLFTFLLLLSTSRSRPQFFSTFFYQTVVVPRTWAMEAIPTKVRNTFLLPCVIVQWLLPSLVTSELLSGQLGGWHLLSTISFQLLKSPILFKIHRLLWFSPFFRLYNTPLFSHRSDNWQPLPKQTALSTKIKNGVFFSPEHQETTK